VASPVQPLDPYRLAQLNARAAAGNLSASAIKRINRAVSENAARISARLALIPPGVPGPSALIESQKILAQTRQALEATLDQVIAEGRSASFTEVLGHWTGANEAAVSVLGEVPKAIAGVVSVPGLTLAGAYEGLGGAAGKWRSLIKGHVSNAVDDANRIIETGLLSGASPQQLAKRLRPYMSGAVPFHKAFGGDAFAAVRNLSLANTPPHLRQAGRKLRNQANRIAHTEIWNARAEAELQHFAADPLVETVRWRLSQQRGQVDAPDICDMLAHNDVYGLGHGIYPINKVPLPPHPYDRCERVPVLRPPEDAILPRPAGDSGGFDWDKAGLFRPSKVKAPVFSKAEAAARRAQFRRHIGLTDQAGVAPALDQTMASHQTRKIFTQICKSPCKAPSGTAVSAPTDKGLMAKLFQQTPDASPKATFLQIKAQFPETALTPQKVNSFKQSLKAKAKKLALAAQKADAEVAPLAPSAPIVTPPSPPAIIPPTPAAGTIPGPSGIKLANGYIEDLVKQGKWTPTEIVDAAKAHYPKAVVTETQVAAKFGELNVPLPAKAGLEAAETIVKPNPTPSAYAQVKVMGPDDLLGTKIQAASGSNTAGPSGLWKGKDGVKRYVKQYADPGQAYAEVISNETYRRLGLAAPKSGLATAKDGKLLFWSEFLEDTQGTLGQAGLTAKRADQVLDGFAADILLGNWDAVGTGLDNVVVRATGKLTRIDQGGSLLWRAQGAKKPLKVLNAIDEWDNFSNAAINPDYAKVFQKAGLGNADALGARAVQQIDDILAVRTDLGGWQAFVDDIAPSLAPTERTRIVDMLEARTKLLVAKRDELAAKLNIPAPKLPKKPPSPIGTPVPQVAKGKIYSKAIEEIEASPASIPGAAAGAPPATDKQLLKAIFEENPTQSPKVALGQIKEAFPDSPITYSKVNTFKQAKKASLKASVAPPAPAKVWASDKDLMQSLVAGDLQIEGGMGGPKAILAAVQDEFPDSTITYQKVNSYKQAMKAKLKAGKPIPNPQPVLAKPGVAGTTTPTPGTAAQKVKLPKALDKELAKTQKALDDVNFIDEDLELAGAVDPGELADKALGQLQEMGINIDTEQLAGLDTGNNPIDVFTYLDDVGTALNEFKATPSHQTLAAFEDAIGKFDAGDASLYADKIKKHLPKPTSAPPGAVKTGVAATHKGVPLGPTAKTDAVSDAVAEAFDVDQLAMLSKADPGEFNKVMAIVAKAGKGQGVQNMAVLSELGADPTIVMAKMIPQLLSGNKVAGATSKSLFKWGVGVADDVLKGWSIEQKRSVMEQALMALAGDTKSIAWMTNNPELNNVKLLKMLQTGKTTAAKKVKALKKAFASQATKGGIVPPGAKAKSIDALPFQIKPDDVASFVADSAYQDNLYFAAGKSTTAKLDVGSIDITKVSDATNGHGFLLEPKPNFGKLVGNQKYKQYAIKSTKAFKGSKGALSKEIRRLSGKAATDLSPAQRTRVMLDGGYDTVVLEANGKVTKVLVLDPKIVKQVKVIVKIPPKPVNGGLAGAPQVTDEAALPTGFLRGEAPNAARLSKAPASIKANAEMPDNARIAMRKYTGSDYYSWNGSLRRSGKHSGGKSKALESYLNKQHPRQNVIVYRGLGSGHPIRGFSYQELQAMIGDELDIDRGFMSSSVNTKWADQFSSEGWIVEIRIKKGDRTRGMWAKPHSSNARENEFVFSTNTRLRLTEVRQEGRKIDPHVNVRFIAEVIE